MRQKTLTMLVACGLAAVFSSAPALASANDNCDCDTAPKCGEQAKPRVIYASAGSTKTKVKAKVAPRVKVKKVHAAPVKRIKPASYRVAPVKVVWAKDAKTRCADLTCACDDEGIGTRVPAPRVSVRPAEWDRVK